MKHLTTMLMVVFALAGCYPEVDDGGYAPGIDGGAGASGSGGSASAAISWCAPSNYNVPCECINAYTAAARTCQTQFDQTRTNPARTGMASCINACFNNAGCDRAYCACVANCEQDRLTQLTQEDKDAIGAAYTCQQNQLRLNCPSLP